MRGRVVGAAVAVCGVVLALLVYASPASAAMYTLFPPSSIPATVTDSDTVGVELGVKFTSDVAGMVTGVRFYKGPQNTGTHYGTLWTAAGVQLARVKFTGESGSGWQQMLFTTPVAITASSTYVVSYFAPRGRYSSTGSYFTSPRDAAPLHAPVNAGVYRYGSSTGFPTSVYQASNYWVDVVLSATVPSPSPSDSTSPSASASATGSPTPTPSDTGTPTPTPTSSQTTTPPVGTNCMPDPSTCGYPDLENTGVPAGTVLTPMSGTVTLSTNGEVFENKLVTGGITVTAADVTIRNVKLVETDPYYGIRAFGWNGVQNLTVQDTEIDMNGNMGGDAIAFDEYTARRVFVHNGSDCASMSHNVTVTDSLCSVGPDVNGDGWADSTAFCNGPEHIDGLQSDGGDGITIRHNTIRNPCNQTSAILMSTNVAPISNVTIDNNLMAGGGWTLYCSAMAAGVPNEHVTGNRFARTFWPQSGYWGPVGNCQGIAEYAGNVWDDTGSPVPA